MDEDDLLIVVSGLVVLIPVAGLTLRFALKPLVDSIARLPEVRNGNSTGSVDLADFYERLAVPRHT